ncbi:MAG: glycosyltransferase family 39 protein [Isosphaeraceae bacterium]
MLDLLFLAILTTGALAVGAWLLDRLGTHLDHALDRIALSLPLGLGVIALCMLALGELGGLTPAVLQGFSGIVAALGLIRLPFLVRSLRQNRNAISSSRVSAWQWPDLALAGSALVALGGSLLTALGPVTDGDALCYHLLVPRRFLERGAVAFDPDLHETVYPLLVEMLYALALAVRGPVACRLVQWLFGLIFGLNVAVLARPFLGQRAWWAGVLALLVPAVSNGMTAPLNDVALAALSVSAVVAWVRYNDQPSVRNALLLGGLAGLAIGVKYPALVLAGLLVVTSAPALLTRATVRMARWGVGGPYLLLRRTRALGRWVGEHLTAPEEAPGLRPRRRLAHLTACLSVMLLVGGGWYARAWWHTGNPVHPFFRHVFGGSGLDEVLGPEKRPLQVTVWNLATALGPLTLQPGRFDSFSHQFGPMFLLFLPALLLERPPRRLVGIAALGYAFFALCLTQRQSMRFVLAALGPLSVAVAWLMLRWWERRSRPGTILVVLMIAAAGFEASLAAIRGRHALPVVLGRESPEAYLARQEPTFTVGRWIDENLPRDARLIGQDHRGFYIPRTYTMELAHRRRTGLGNDGASPIAVVEALRSEGFTHLLVCPPEPETAVEFDGTLTRKLAPWLSRQEPLYSAELRDGDGVVRHYAIYSLEAGAGWLASPAPTRRPSVDAAVRRTGDLELRR